MIFYILSNKLNRESIGFVFQGSLVHEISPRQSTSAMSLMVTCLSQLIQKSCGNGSSLCRRNWQGLVIQ